MNLIKNLLITALVFCSASLYADNRGNGGGDDAGNGGFAYKQSIKILKMATEDLEGKIQGSTMQELIDHPEWRVILQDTLLYENLRKLYFWTDYRDGKKLAMNYSVKPARVTILKPYYVAFSGKTDSELEDASLEVQKRLLHEASHIWGYNEIVAEKFSIEFLKNYSGHGNRPTNAIEIKNDFCSCLDGKSDLINSCENFCATMPRTSVPTLYAGTILGPEITLNSRLGNLYNWCTAQLPGDATTPQCMLEATDGTNTVNIPVSVKPGSNSFQANIQALQKNKTYILKLVESKTGSNAQSKEFQVRRINQPIPGDDLGALKVNPVNQYTCIFFGGLVDPNGTVIRQNFVRQYYYFASNETPSPLPPTNGTSMKICHDDQAYPGNDSVMYPRLELIPNHFIAWDKSDSRFMSSVETGGKMRIDRIIEERLMNEYGINANINLFNLVSFPNSINSGATQLGYMMVPFVSEVGKATCPSSFDNSSTNPLLNILGDYLDNTEGIYLGEKEAEIINEGPNQRIFYGTMFVRESTLLDYGFYVENGVKIRATPQAMHVKNIYYYWPISQTQDPLSQGSRKLFTVKSPGSMNGNLPVGIPTSIPTSDKRIGCVPKGNY